MSNHETESGRAGHEARQDVVSHAGRPDSSSDRRYDALLRYLRGLYVRPQKEAKDRRGKTQSRDETPDEDQK
jgi:hypothetical protein